MRTGCHLIVNVLSGFCNRKAATLLGRLEWEATQYCLYESDHASGEKGILALARRSERCVLKLSLRESAFYRPDQTAATALINPMEESVINCWVCA